MRFVSSSHISTGLMDKARIADNVMPTGSKYLCPYRNLHKNIFHDGLSSRLPMIGMVVRFPAPENML